jgi:hypothetical protein
MHKEEKKTKPVKKYFKVREDTTPKLEISKKKQEDFARKKKGIYDRRERETTEKSPVGTEHG